MGIKKSIVVVTRQTRLAGLRARWGTSRQARFVLTQAHAHEEQRRGRKAFQKREKSKAASPLDALQEVDFLAYEDEDATYSGILERLERELDFGLPVKFIDRAFVPNFDFWSAAAVVVVGQDGLVANVAKYVGELPIVAVNPDPKRFDGVLLPFQATQAGAAVGRVLRGQHRSRRVTLAQVELNDGQRMLAFNDFYLGSATHTSARYTIETAGHCEPQSSSGVLVSTGAGSTGWMSSVFNMASGISQLLGDAPKRGPELSWEDRRLMWAVREPFASRHSQANLVAGVLAEGEHLVLESLMPESGVIFSDGIEADFLAFNTGAIARISAAQQTANLVVS